LRELAARASGATLVAHMAAVRRRAGAAMLVRDAQPFAHLCHRMAERFARGGRLIALGRSPQARSDARHVAVEFVHPVIVGKRALPAIALTGTERGIGERLALHSRPGDVVMTFETFEEMEWPRDCLRVAFAADGAAWTLPAHADEPLLRQELVETLYHVLWELVHVFFEHRGLLSGGDRRSEIGQQIARRSARDAGAASFLYPFLAERESALEPVVEDVARSARAKCDEAAALREQTLLENEDALALAAGALTERLAAGGKLLALGNGGSATDAMDIVADFEARSPSTRARPAIDLSEDSSIITAIANDIGAEAIFSRQVIAYGDAGDALITLSTSGSSANVIEALGEARRRGLLTIAMVGYDGGRIASQSLADHVVITRSEHIPRIQEAQASAYHALRELVDVADAVGASA
jgi:D-sedoheptulose 7-phosphate isomerase